MAFPHEEPGVELYDTIETPSYSPCSDNSLAAVDHHDQVLVLFRLRSYPARSLSGLHCFWNAHQRSLDYSVPP